MLKDRFLKKQNKKQTHTKTGDLSFKMLLESFVINYLSMAFTVKLTTK